MSNEQERALPARGRLFDQPLGARFRYPGNERVYVLLGYGDSGLVADAILGSRRTQGVYSAAESRAEFEAMEVDLVTDAAPQVPAVPDTWSVYVATMIGAYLGWGVDDERIQAVAGIIERRRWAAQPAPQAPLTDEQWKTRIGDRQLFTVLEAIRFVEKVYGIAAGVKEPGNA